MWYCKHEQGKHRRILTSCWSGFPAPSSFGNLEVVLFVASVCCCDSSIDTCSEISTVFNCVCLSRSLVLLPYTVFKNPLLPPTSKAFVS